jgi:hypothetical protein
MIVSMTLLRARLARQARPSAAISMSALFLPGDSRQHVSATEAE